MKTSEYLEQYKNLLRLITGYKESYDYHINCLDNAIELEIKNDELMAKIRKNTIRLEKPPASEKTCLVTRILSITETNKYIMEIKTLLVASKILQCTSNIEALIVLDDLSHDIVLTTYYFSQIKDAIESITPEKILEISIYVKYLQLLKNILNHIKDLQKQLHYIHDPRKEEEYRVELSKLDNLMPTISKLWEKNREFFDKIHNLINKEEKTIEEIIKETLNNPKYLTKLEHIKGLWRKYIENILDKELEYKIMFLSEAIPVSPELKELDVKLNYLITHLRSNLLCKEIIFLDGEEYSILQKYTGLEFDNINIQ